MANERVETFTWTCDVCGQVKIVNGQYGHERAGWLASIHDGELITAMEKLVDKQRYRGLDLCPACAKWYRSMRADYGARLLAELPKRLNTHSKEEK